jgi:type II secretory pathway pseudopilin PulG
LVELMISITIVGIFSGATIGLISQSARTTSIATEKQQILLATKTVYDDAVRMGNNGTINAGNATFEPDLNLTYPVTIKRQITSVSGSYRMFNVTVTTTWAAKNDKRRSGTIVLSGRVFKEP